MFSAVVAVATIGLAVPASAAVDFDFGTIVSGGSPAGGPYWAHLTIANSGVNEVTFTLTNTSNPATAGGQFLSTLLLNIDPYVATTSNWTSPSIDSATSALNGYTRTGATFDYKVEFVTANNGNRLTPGKSATWTATGTGLSEDDFLGFSTGNAQWRGLVHIQSIPPTGDSTWAAPVPEPASMAALGLGVVALLRRRKK